MPLSLKDYWPLFIVIGICLAASLAISMDHTRFLWHGWMHYFMGLLYIVFSLLKFINLDGFKTGLKKYDIIAQRFSGYATLFPFVELGLGLGYLLYGPTIPLNMGAFAFAIINLAVVTRALRLGLDVRCACLGTALNVPLSTVTVIENAGMALMALVMLGCAL